MILFCLCFENDIHSTIQLFAEYCKLSVFICGVVFQYIKVMCLRFYFLSHMPEYGRPQGGANETWLGRVCEVWLVPGGVYKVYNKWLISICKCINDESVY